MSLRPRLCALLAVVCLAQAPSASPADAPAPTSVVAAQEIRAHALFRQIRCVVCQNESIDDSEAPLAGDLRQIVREKIAAGRDDAQIRRFLTDRYGEFVLLKPRFSPATAVLWTAPFLIVLGGFGGFAARGRSRHAPAAVAPLSAEERDRLAVLAVRDPGPPRGLRGGDMLPPDTGLTKGYDFN